jgi:hypothetical protein
MNDNQNMTDRLWNFIDGTVTKEEHDLISALVRENMAWKEEYEQLLSVNELLKSSELEEPGMRFTKNVMEEIARMRIAPAAKTYINKRIIWGLGIFFITMVVGFLVYGFGQMDWTAAASDNSMLQNLPRFDVSKFFNNAWVNAFMMVNVVLGLVILDHYLTRKKNEFRKEA